MLLVRTYVLYIYLQVCSSKYKWSGTGINSGASGQVSQISFKVLKWEVDIKIYNPKKMIIISVGNLLK